MIIAELQEYNIKVDRAILDNGYYSENNIKLLIDNNIYFVTKMIVNRELYNDLINIHVPLIKNRDNFVTYNGRPLFVKKVPIKLFKEQLNAFAYICLDVNQQYQDEIKYFSELIDKNTDKQTILDLNKNGVFILTSTINLQNNEILPFYYTRQTVDQIFDYLKNENDILSIRANSELAFNGYILICFMATISYIALNQALNNKNISINDAFDLLKRFHCRKYSDRLIPDIVTKKINDITKILKVKLPKTIDIKNR
jgi:transposase